MSESLTSERKKGESGWADQGLGESPTWVQSLAWVFEHVTALLLACLSNWKDKTAGGSGLLGTA